MQKHLHFAIMNAHRIFQKATFPTATMCQCRTGSSCMMGNDSFKAIAKHFGICAYYLDAKIRWDGW